MRQMMVVRRLGLVVVFSVMNAMSVRCQDTLVAVIRHQQEQYAADTKDKVDLFNKQVASYTSKSLDRVIGQERRMQKKVARVDSVKAKLLFQYSIDSLKNLKAAINNKTAKLTRFFKGNYFPYFDTLKQSLSFLNKAQGAADQVSAAQERLKASLGSMDEMEAKLGTVEQINEYLKQRQQVLQTQLTSFPGIGDNLKNINKEAYYYQSQVSEYKNTLSDPDKIEKLVLGTLQKAPAFQKFFMQNSQLAGLFGSTPGLSSMPGGLGATPVVNGLPSRATLQQWVQQQLPGLNNDPAQAIQQQVDAMGKDASAAGGGIPGLDQLQNKAAGMRNGQVGDASMPDFTPNSQRGKSFGKRLEFGANMQFGSSSNYLPASTQFGFQVGYKLNDKSSIGIGASYTMGLGSGWSHIRLSSQALGFRSYVKWKPKKAFFLQGGGEWNYMTGFSSIAQLRDLNAWQASALLGIGKEYKINKKMGGSVLLLYDFLANRHRPVTQPLSFRIGYNF
ncbi:MAG: hypothetical protein JST42_05440 [Bacteroidetes bacterium]|nr:hypothetical protein [Bacteroidota bacterium]